VNQYWVKSSLEPQLRKMRVLREVEREVGERWDSREV
jgi:hypothetical protein